MDYQLIIKILRALNEQKVQYRIVGGVALNLWGLARATKDLDIFVSPDKMNIARLRTALNSVFNDPEIENITAEDLGGVYPAIQYVPPEGIFHIDILARLGERFKYEDIECEQLEIEDVLVWVASPKMLYRMKKDTIRLQDRADAERIRNNFNLNDDN